MPPKPLPPEQAETPSASAARIRTGIPIAARLRRLPERPPKMGISMKDKIAPPPTRAAATLLLMVSVLVAAAVPFGVTLDGVNVQVA